MLVSDGVIELFNPFHDKLGRFSRRSENAVMSGKVGNVSEGQMVIDKGKIKKGLVIAGVGIGVAVLVAAGYAAYEYNKPPEYMGPGDTKILDNLTYRGELPEKWKSIFRPGRRLYVPGSKGHRMEKGDIVYPDAQQVAAFKDAVKDLHPDLKKMWKANHMAGENLHVLINTRKDMDFSACSDIGPIMSESFTKDTAQHEFIHHIVNQKHIQASLDSYTPKTYFKHASVFNLENKKEDLTLTLSYYEPDVRDWAAKLFNTAVIEHYSTSYRGLSLYKFEKGKPVPIPISEWSDEILRKVLDARDFMDLVEKVELSDPPRLFLVSIKAIERVEIEQRSKG